MTTTSRSTLYALSCVALTLAAPANAEVTVTEPSIEVAADAVAEPPKSCCTLPSRWGATQNAARLSIEESEAGARVLIDGELFAEYLADADPQPVVWPIRGPSGHGMTRSWPLGPALPTEEDDHPHHRSLWFSHGGVNGYDFWHQAKDARVGVPRIVHKGFIRRQIDAGDTVVIETSNDWTAAGESVLADNRTLRFGLLDHPQSDAASRYIDFTITLHAAYGPVVFADTKEGSFAVRVPGPMKLDAGLGGQIMNDRDQTDANAWGRASAWVVYQGPIAITPQGEAAPHGGIVMMSHPSSFRPRCRWHVRGYGLFAANPFGDGDFPREEPRQGTYKLESDEKLTLRYRVVLFENAVDASVVRDWYAQFAEN